MSEPGERYRLYVDESGDHVYHDERTLTQPGHRYLALVGCWMSTPICTAFHYELENLKQHHFPHNPDDPIILHRKDIMYSRWPFSRLKDEGCRAAFDNDIVNLLERLEFTLVGIVIDKLEMKRCYPSPFHPYHQAMALLLERYCGYLRHTNRTGDVMAESRGGKEDKLLANAYDHIYTHGTRFHRAEVFQRTLTSKELKLKKKSANISGLQLADLLANTVGKHVLLDHRRLLQQCTAFEKRLMGILEAKYNRQLYDNRVEGYGRVLFPKEKGP